MTTTKTDLKRKQDDQSAQPDVATETLAQADTHSLGALASNTPASPANDDTEPEKKAFDPWRFGAHTVPPGFRQELFALEVPETPDEHLFHPRGTKEQKTSDSESPAAGTAASRADTLRLRRPAQDRPPLVHPLRVAAPWAAFAAVLVFVVLWLIGRGEEHPASKLEAPTARASVETAAPMPTPPPAPPGEDVAPTHADVVTSAEQPVALKPSRSGSTTGPKPPLKTAAAPPDRSTGADLKPRASAPPISLPAASVPAPVSGGGKKLVLEPR